MNSKVDYLISCIRRAIPPQILERIFLPPVPFNHVRPSLEHALRNKIIDGWVGIDCNVVGGIECHVDLSICSLTYYPGGTLVQIPDSATGGKNITSVLSLSYGMGTWYGADAGNLISNAAIGPEQLTMSRVQLVGPNMVYVEGGIISNMRFLRCVVENDKDFANISDRSLPVLAEMCVLATKAYCYNFGVIDTANAEIIQGLTMGKYADILNEWSDSLEMYNELRDKKWKKITIMNDRVSYNRLIRAISKR